MVGPKPTDGGSSHAEAPIERDLLAGRQPWIDCQRRGRRSNHRGFETELTRALSTTPVNLLVDVTECELAAAGLAALLHLESHHVSKVVLIATEPAMLGILRIAGVFSKYRIYPTLERALDACRANNGDPLNPGQPSEHVATPTFNAGRSQWLRIGTPLNG